MTDPTGSPSNTPPPSTPRRLIVSAPVTPKPRFLTPGAQQQQTEEQQTIAAEEQSGMPAEQAVAMGIPVPETTPAAPGEPVRDEPAPTPQQETTAAEEQAGGASEESVVDQLLGQTSPVPDAAPQPATAEEPAGQPSQDAVAEQLLGEPVPASVVRPEPSAPEQQESQVSQDATVEQLLGEPVPRQAVETPAGQPAPAPGSGLIDPKIAETLSKIKEAQEELERAQQQALAMVAASINPATAQPPTNIPVPEAPPVQAAPVQPVPAGPRLNVPGAPAPSVSPATTPVPTLRPAMNAAPAQAAPGFTPVQPAATAAGQPPAAPPVSPIAAKYMPKAPEPFLKSKAFKMYAIIFGVVLLAVGGYGWHNHVKAEEGRKINAVITDLRKVGAQLSEKAKELGQKSTPKLNYQFKYSPSEYGITVSPDKEKASILITAIRTHNQRFEWESELHVLTVMATQDLSIADALFDDIRKNPRQYGDDKLTQMAILVSSQKNPQLQNKLLKLADDLGKANVKKQAAIMSQAFYGMTGEDLPGLVQRLVDPETPDGMRTPLSTSIDYIMLRSATDTQKQAVAKELLTALHKADDKRKMELYRLLAKTGAPQALNQLKAMITQGEPASSQAIRALADWPNDDINPVLLDILNSGKITDPRKLNDIRSLALMQLAYDRKRTDEEGLAMYKPYMDAADKEQDEDKKKESKLLVIYSLRNLPLHGYVKQMLDQYAKDGNSQVAMEAKAAINKITDREKAKNTPVKTRAEQEAEILKMLEGTTSGS